MTRTTHTAPQKCLVVALEHCLDKHGSNGARLAKSIGTTPANISKIRTGKGDGTISMWSKIADHFGYCFGDFFILGKTILGGSQPTSEKQHIEEGDDMATLSDLVGRIYDDNKRLLIENEKLKNQLENILGGPAAARHNRELIP